MNFLASISFWNIILSYFCHFAFPISWVCSRVTHVDIQQFLTSLKRPVRFGDSYAGLPSQSTAFPVSWFKSRTSAVNYFMSGACPVFPLKFGVSPLFPSVLC